MRHVKGFVAGVVAALLALAGYATWAVRDSARANDARAAAAYREAAAVADQRSR